MNNINVICQVDLAWFLMGIDGDGGVLMFGVDRNVVQFW